MIAKPEIAKWQEHAPWKEFAQAVLEVDPNLIKLLIGN